MHQPRMHATIALGLLLALAGCGGGGSGTGATTSSVSTGSSSPTPVADGSSAATANCTTFTPTYVTGYGASPEAWGVTTQMGFTNCVSISARPNGAASAQFDWNWQSFVGSPVLGYPSIFFGAKPGATSTSTSLPRLTSQLNSVIVNWNTTLTHGDGTDSGDVLLDNWITNRSDATDYTQDTGVAVELMVFLDNWGANWATYYLGWPVVTINGSQYYFSGAPDGNVNNGQYTSAAVYRASFFPVHQFDASGSLDLKPFLDYLVGQQLIPGNLYLADVEFGNEINQGTGRDVVNSFSVQVQ